MNVVDMLFATDNNKDGIAHPQIARIDKNLSHRITQLCLMKTGVPELGFAAYCWRVIQGFNGGLSTSAHKEGSNCLRYGYGFHSRFLGFEKFRQKMFVYGRENLDARPHWGKWIPDNFNVEELYGKVLP